MRQPIKVGRTVGSFARIKEVLKMPDLIEIQQNSYQWFLEHGIQRCLLMFRRFRTLREI